MTSRCKQSERRLVEYFVVVSCLKRSNDEFTLTEHSSFDNSLNDIESNKKSDHYFPWSTKIDKNENKEHIYDFQPIVTSRYPHEDHVDNPLQKSVVFFCHPTGVVHIKSKKCMPKVHYFVMTGGKGSLIYGICLTLYESLLISEQLSNSKQVVILQNDIYIPKCICILSTYPYLVAFREFLVQLHRLTKIENLTLPVERFITNFCSEIPAPPPGSFEVQMTILDSIIKFWSPPHNQPIAWVSLPFSYLFECLDIDNIITIWHALALERQILVTSTQLSLITICCEILLSLLFPMRWSHAYIPILPNFLSPFLSAPMPYLCGLDKLILPNALLHLSDECIIVDLDNNQITMGPGTSPLPSIPSNYLRNLREKLEYNAGMIFREARSLTRNDDFSEYGQYLPSQVKQMADALWESKLLLYDEAFQLAFTPDKSLQNFLNGNDNSGMETSENDPFSPGIPIRIMTMAEKQSLRKQSQWDAVQEAFLCFFVSLLRNYRKFLVFPSKEGSDGSSSYGGAGFRSKEFIQSQKYALQMFLKQLVSTQMFDHFVTKRLYGSGAADVIFFDQTIDKYLKKHGIVSDVGIQAVDGNSRFGIQSKYIDVCNRSNKAYCHRYGRSRIWNILNVVSRKKYSDGKCIKEEEPILQSARVHRKLKTIVPPEPSGADLPLMSNLTEKLFMSTCNGEILSRSLYNRKEIISNENNFYMYPRFPSYLDQELFGIPRPLPSAVLAEFDRQRENAAKFRRRKLTDSTIKNDSKPGGYKFIRSSNNNHIKAEVTTFTVFFFSYTAVVGKRLLELSDDTSNDLSNPEERDIFTTYIHKSQECRNQKEVAVALDGDANSDENNASLDDKNTSEKLTDNSIGNKSFNRYFSNSKILTRKDNKLLCKYEFGIDEAIKFSSKHILTSRSIENNDDESRANISNETKIDNDLINDKKVLRKRFKNSLAILEIEEAKETSKAELDLAFEMLKMMRKRGLKADPVAYQCLIDACGRCGDTGRATELLLRMHEDGIIADGVVYSCLVSAFSKENAWRKVSEKLSGKVDENLPEWANGASVEMDWNKLQKRSIVERARSHFRFVGYTRKSTATVEMSEGKKFMRRNILISKMHINQHSESFKRSISRSAFVDEYNPYIEPPNVEKFVTDSANRQINFGENLLEILYPDISIDTENEFCPRCNYLLTDDDVVNGWSPYDCHDYTTKCPVCPQKLVPHFRVESTSPSFTGSCGTGTPLFCERLSPWVLLKELRSVMHDRDGIDEILDPRWRENESKNSVLWWNMILSFMRYRFPITFLLQGSFDQNLIAPLSLDDNELDY